MSRDLRKYGRQTTVQLVVGALMLLFLVGGGLIYLIYGPGAAVTALLCMGALLLPVALVMVFFRIIDWIIKRSKENE
ncbi:MAG TPA: hypothetical protein VMS73_02615 [Anaerolineaceae bacterium]|nr:hypothetical protein [Anaerolineaceae bacterium]